MEKPTVLFATFSDLDTLLASGINDRKFAQLLTDFCETDVAYVARRRSHGSKILAYLKLARKLISPKRYAIIICRGPIVGLLGIMIKRKVVLHLSDGVFHTAEIKNKILPKHSPFRFLDYAFFSVLETISISKADSVIVGNNRAVELLSHASRLSRDRIYVVPSFIEEPIFGLKQIPDRKKALIVGYTGNFMPHDKVLEMIDAIKECNSQGTPVQLHLAGRGPLLEKAAKRAEPLIGSIIHFRGILSRASLLDLFREIDVLLCPMSQNIVPSTIPLKIIEGAAAGKAVVTTDCGLTRSLFGDSLMYAEEPLVDNITKSLTLLYEKPELRMALGARARKVARNNFSRQVSNEAMRLFIRNYRLNPRKKEIEDKPS